MKSRKGMSGCFLSASEFLQLIIGYLIYKHLKGRRFLLQIILLIIIFLAEVIHILIYTFTDEFEDTNNDDGLFLNFESDLTMYLITIQGIPVYTLFYMLCICGPLDLAKVELLKSNIKVHSLLYGVLCGL